jgi:hypothetical protein
VVALVHDTSIEYRTNMFSICVLPSHIFGATSRHQFHSQSSSPIENPGLLECLGTPPTCPTPPGLWIKIHGGAVWCKLLHKIHHTAKKVATTDGQHHQPTIHTHYSMNHSMRAWPRQQEPLPLHLVPFAKIICSRYSSM